MIHFPIHQLAHLLGSDVAVDNAAFFTGVTIDTRNINPGDCYIAIKGATHDGHNFVEQAFEKGAVCAIVEKSFVPAKPLSAPLIRVPDTILALGQFARAYRRQLSAKIVAITGSAGKTTTRQIAYHVLSKHFKCHVAQKSFNNNIGMPLTILGINPDDQIAILELGTNNIGEIIYLAKIAEPDIAVVTNAYDAHIENFGSVQAIIQEKTSIAKGLRPSELLIINQDSPALEEFCRNQHLPNITFGKTDRADIVATDIEPDGFTSTFKIDGIQVHLPLPGKGNVDNALAAFSICKQFGLSAADFARALKDLPGISMRLEPIHHGKLTLISDCYNANPASMRNALELLSHIGKKRSQRLVFICGPMMELGEHAQRLHSELGVKVAESGIALLLAVGPFAPTVAQAAKKTSQAPLETYCFEDTKTLCDNVSKFLKSDDIILVKGSRAAKLEAVVDKIKELFANQS